MRTLNLFILLLSIFLFSCKSKSTESQDLESKQPPLNIQPATELDNLDSDTSSFITTNFSDTVKQILYATNHKLFGYILRSYILQNKNDTFFSLPTLRQIVLADSFRIDTSNNQTILWKHLFNKRQQIEWSKKKGQVRIVIVNQLWFNGKKYELIWLRILPDKKDESVYDDF
jgi:hypothetical protein